MAPRLVRPLVFVSLALVASSQATLRVSVDSHGLEGFDHSATAAVSGDGQRIVFASRAPLSPDDVEGFQDIWVHDREQGTTMRVSVSSAGLAADADCLGPSISEDGRFVAYRTSATNLVSGDANGKSDVFLHDLQNGTTERISVDAAGADSDGQSFYGSISQDGRWVAFQSDATDLAPGDTNLTFDVFVRDCLTGTTELVSVASDGQSAGIFQFSYDPSISKNGRIVAFASIAQNFAPGATSGQGDVFVRDLAAGTTELISSGLGGAAANGASSVPSVSANGRYVVFASTASNLVPNDTNGVEDVFVHDRATSTTERVSVASDGSEGNGRSYLYYVQPSLSGDGRYVVFESYASNLAAPDTTPYVDIFVRDLWAGTTELASLSSAGQAGHLGGTRATISSDGQVVVFESTAATLVAGDTNELTDVFVRDRASVCAPVQAYCDAKTSSVGCFPRSSSAGQPSISGAEAFHVTATSTIAGQPGTFVYGFAEGSQPFGGGLLCVAPPFARTPTQLALDVPQDTGSPCTGGYTLAFDAAFMAANGITAGTTVFGQWISRDPGAPSGIGLTDGLRFTTCP